MKISRWVTSAAFAVVLAAACPAWSATPANTLVIADAIDDVISLDPGEVSEVGGVLTSNQLYQPLVSFDVNDPAKIIGVLAESWTVSPDGKVYTFK
jgi:peptide/nickel transport system substrate-binding protein